MWIERRNNVILYVQWVMIDDVALSVVTFDTEFITLTIEPDVIGSFAYSENCEGVSTGSYYVKF